ncbi:lysostaphin resistance A-like protein [Microbacterium sp. NPDC078428]|uniref:lysostaphin resistance A-like protein n=1 Tax=Microbacterium sp. NPDC078428 TaxID=3364190 RepID=UPI0037CB2BF4
MIGAPEAEPASTERVQWVPAVTFYLLACALAWAIDLPLWIGGVALTSPLGILLISASMYTPAAAAFFAVIVVQRTHGRAILRRLGWWPIRPVRRTILLAVVGLIGSALLPIVTVFLAAALGLTKLDLVNFSGFAHTLDALLPVGTTLPIPVQLLAIIQLVEIPIGALINSLLTLGEETGWRGFLLPALRPLGTWPALVMSGAAWGLWHAPVILLGYNFAQPNLYGLLLMIVGCIAYGILIGWLRIRSGNIWPSVIAHGAFNAAGGFSALVIAAGATANPAAVGPLGWVAWIVMAAVALVLALTRQVPRKNAWPAVTSQRSAERQTELRA